MKYHKAGTGVVESFLPEGTRGVVEAIVATNILGDRENKLVVRLEDGTEAKTRVYFWKKVE